MAEIYPLYQSVRRHNKMMRRRRWLQIVAALGFTVSAIPCVVLSVKTMLDPAIQESGVFTLELIPSLLPTRNPDSVEVVDAKQFKTETSITPATVTIVPKFLDKMGTRTSDITDPKQSTASAAAGVVESAVNRVVPRNCSLGTERFCLGYSERVECKYLPVEAPKLIPTPTINPGALEPLNGMTKRLASISIRGFLIARLVLIPILGMFLAWAIWKPELKSGLRAFPKPLIITLYILLCCIFFVTFLIPTIVLDDMVSKARQLSPDIKRGDAGPYCLGALCCAAVMIWCTVIPVALNAAQN